MRLVWEFNYKSANSQAFFRMPSQVTFVMNYFEPNRLYTWTEASLRIDPLAVPPAVGDGTPHGAYYWDQKNTLLYIKVIYHRSAGTKYLSTHRSSWNWLACNRERTVQHDLAKLVRNAV